MPNRLNLPADLASLIEKRENEERRQAERRTETDAAANEVEQRSGQDRRSETRRDDDK